MTVSLRITPSLIHSKGNRYIKLHSCYENWESLLTWLMDGLQEVLRFLDQLTISMGENVEFNVDHYCEGGDGYTVTVNWHLGISGSFSPDDFSFSIAAGKTIHCWHICECRLEEETGPFYQRLQPLWIIKRPRKICHQVYTNQKFSLILTSKWYYQITKISKFWIFLQENSSYHWVTNKTWRLSTGISFLFTFSRHTKINLLTT